MEWSQVENVVRAVIAAADKGNTQRAWKRLRPAIEAAKRDELAARALARVLRCDALECPRRFQLAQRLLKRWSGELVVTSALGNSTEHLVDVSYLNAAPPSDPYFDRLATVLTEQFDGAVQPVLRAVAGEALTCVGRLAGHRWDEACERAHRFLLEFEPKDWTRQYDYGLFLKTRGRFAEGAEANRAAARLGGADRDAVIWNLGICATAIGDGQTALELWRRIGCKLELGDDGLPTGRFDPVQVRLARQPLATRDAEHDDPGEEETIWVERLSPCHGRVVSALYHDLGVDYGDLVLFDGAPIVVREWAGRSVPVFPQIVTLRRSGWSIFPFAATQDRANEVAELGDRLGGDTTLYVHTENLRALCPSCWEGAKLGHAHAEQPHRVVTGKLVIPPAVPLADIAGALQREEAQAAHPRVYVPDLWAALGDPARAETQRRWYHILASAEPAPVE